MSNYGKPRSAKGLATLCAKLADDKLAKDIVIIDLGSLEFSPTNYFVICTCESEAQIDAVVYNIERTIKNLGLLKPRIEGLDSKDWVLLDMFDVVIHIFLKDIRNYYKLEKLWGDGNFYELNESRELRKITDKNLLNVIKDKVFS